MAINERPWELECDDLTVVTMLLADDDISLGWVDVEDDPHKRARDAHCTWHLNVRGHTPEEIDVLLTYIKSFGGKCYEPRHFSFACPQCRFRWIDDGPCSDECANAMLGRLPDHHAFDFEKRVVVRSKRQAQESLADARGEGPIYGTGH